MAYLPKPYNLLQDVTHLENVRPMSQAVGLGLDKDMAQEGIADPQASGPDGRPNVLKRISIKPRGIRASAIKAPHPLRIRA